MDYIKNDFAAILFTKEQIRQRVEELGRQITADYDGKHPIVVCILKGAGMFMADLIREIRTPINIDFMAVSSYGSGTESSGVIKIKKDMDRNPDGRHILIVEDIVDTGRTLSRLKEELEKRGAVSVKICTFLNKPSRRVIPVDVDYCGFEVDDEFIVGYGVDYDERYRNVPFIGILKRDIYEHKEAAA